MMGDCCGAGFGMMLLWAVFLAAIVVGAILLVRAFWRSADSSAAVASDAEPPALRVLEERFARGEIDHDEFERRREVLRT